MNDDLEAWSAFGVTASLASSYAQDIRGFLPLLAVILQGCMPDETVIERKGGIFQKQKPIRRVAVTLGDHIYSIVDNGHGPLDTSRVKVVRGIVLKTDPMPVDTWLEFLGDEIAARAQQNEKAFFALRNLLS